LSARPFPAFGWGGGRVVAVDRVRVVAVDRVRVVAVDRA